MKKILLIALLCICSTVAGAQFVKVYLGINGLTCSQCSRSVEMRLRKLDFIESINMDLEHTNALLVLDTKKNPDFASIARSVKDAGFSVRYLKADFNVPEGAVLQNGGIRYKGKVYKMAGNSNIPLQGTVTFVFTDNEFVPRSKQVKQPKKDDPKLANIYTVVVQ